MTSTYIYQILNHPNINQRIARRYIEFIKLCNSFSDEYTENHHILPRSIYPEFDNLKIYSWNSKPLTARQHFIAHCLLARAFNKNTKEYFSMINAFNMMGCNSNTQVRYMNSRLYEQNRKHMSNTMSNRQTGKNNSQYGTMWVTNQLTFKTIKIQENLYSLYYDQEWRKGRLIPTLSASNKKYAMTTNQGISIKMFHPMNCIITKIKSNFMYEYLIDGWLIFKTGNTDMIQIKRDNKNLKVSNEQSKYFMKFGWIPGLYVANHKGTSGKTYSWINGKKVFD